MALTLHNAARARLAEGELAVGLVIRQARTVDIARILKTCGYDWLFLDLEHGALTLDQTVQIAVAAQDAGIAPLVRVPAGQYWMASQALDGGAQGIVMPHVDRPEQAEALAAHLRYPPAGHRSYGGPIAQLGFRALDYGEATAAVNASNLIVAMIETPEGVANADKIAAVPGIDALLIGTSDLSLEMGIPGQLGDARIEAAYRTVIEACRRHGKHPGMGGVDSAELVRRYVGLGMRLVLGGSDLSLLIGAATARATLIRDAR